MSYKDLAIRPRFWIGSVLLFLFLAVESQWLSLPLPVSWPHIQLGAVIIYWFLFGISTLRFRLSHIKDLHDLPLILFNLILTAFLIWSVLNQNALFAVPHLLLSLYITWVFQKVTLGKGAALPQFKQHYDGDHMVTVKNKSLTTQKKAKDIEVGEHIIIHPSETVLVDGLVVNGTTSMDVSVLTNEFTPIMKSTGAWISAGSINRDSVIEIEAKSTYETSFYKNWTQSLQSAEWFKNFVQKRVQGLSLLLTVLGIISTAGAAAYSHLVVGLDWIQSVQNSIFILPCFSALSLIPVWKFTYKDTLEQIFNKGIFINKAESFDKIAKLNTLFITKTGMLTKGKLAFSQCFLEMGTNQGQVLSTLFSLESESTHPLSDATETHPWFNEFDLHKVQKWESHPGLGICGTVQPMGERPYFAAVGNLRFLKRMQMHVSRDMRAKADELERMGETVVLCGFKRQVKAVISFVDSLRHHIRESLQLIQKLGIELIFITGDSSESLRPITDALNIENVYPRCTPDEKARKITKQKQMDKVTGIVGTDQDEEAFKEADLSLSLATGTRTANRNADILILGKDFRRLAWLIKTVKVLYQNTKLLSASAAFVTVALASIAAFTSASPIMILATLFTVHFILVFMNSNNQSSSWKTPSKNKPNSLQLKTN